MTLDEPGIVPDLYIFRLFHLIFPSMLPSRLYFHHFTYENGVGKRISNQIKSNLLCALFIWQN